MSAIMYSSSDIPSFLHKQVFERSKFVTQRPCEQARNLGTGTMMNSMLQKQMLEKYNCEKCRFSTKDVNKYKNHVSLHNDIKYACSHCDFVSYTKTEFQRHLVKHTGKFPFTCGYCGYGAIRNDYIVKHIRRIHGDGKIQCSVSTVENESKKASVNIMQTQVMAPSVQKILENSPSSLTEDVIDLTSEVDSLGSSSNIIFPNGNNVADHVEVEVISPADQQLYPWVPLTVVAPTSFKVPHNCIAQVVEVKPVNSACHLVLKCLNLVESSVPNQPVVSEHIYEQKPSEPVMPSKNITETPVIPSAKECAVIRDDCQENILCPSKTGTQENLNTEIKCSMDTTNNTVSPIDTVTNDIFDDLEEFTGGPIISAVFSLSSDSQHTIEGIQWESPFSSPSTSSSNESVVATQSSPNPPVSQEQPDVFSPDLNSEMDIEKPQDDLKKTVLETEKEAPEIEIENVKQSAVPEIQLPITSLSADIKKPESQPCAPQKSRKGGRISDRLGKIETSSFSKPQVLFLSCDKRIVMQPLSCTMQSINNQTLLVDKVTEQLQVPTQKESTRVKVKTLVAHTMKGRSQPNLRTLKLHPLKADQVANMPCYNQPVVVLNHPDVESMETSHIMKAIRVFRGKITKVTLSKQTKKNV
ncbi:zinc finger protein 518B [Dendropsophus ebraccatus]|uniref:zinc finger protein 518B n=1 Tax=Dendropsophus ebraccatus TaxID=150705 RepID=UPI00383232EF